MWEGKVTSHQSQYGQEVRARSELIYENLGHTSGLSTKSEMTVYVNLM